MFRTLKKVDKHCVVSFSSWPHFRWLSVSFRHAKSIMSLLYFAWIKITLFNYDLLRGHSNNTWHSWEGEGQCHQIPKGGWKGLAKVSRDIFSKILNHIFLAYFFLLSLEKVCGRPCLTGFKGYCLSNSFQSKILQKNWLRIIWIAPNVFLTFFLANNHNQSLWITKSFFY